MANYKYSKEQKYAAYNKATGEIILAESRRKLKEATTWASHMDLKFYNTKSQWTFGSHGYENLLDRVRGYNKHRD